MADRQQQQAPTFWDRHPFIWLLLVVLAVPVAVVLFVLLSPVLFLAWLLWMVEGSTDLVLPPAKPFAVWVVNQRPDSMR